MEKNREAKTFIPGLGSDFTIHLNELEPNLAQQILDLLASAGVAPKVDWADINNKPSTFSPSTHTHTTAQITDLSWNTLSGKPSTFSPSTHTHTASQITDFSTAVTSATTSKLTANKVATQANSTATDVAGLVTDFNALLAKLKTAGVMS